MKIFTHTFIVISVIFLASALFYPLPTFYITGPSQALSAESSESLDSQEAKVWASRDQCEEVVTKGGHMAPVKATTLRLGTWNVRWFPIGMPEAKPGDDSQRTDLEWLACTMLWMQVDIWAIQESLDTSEAQNAWKKVIKLLQEKSGGTWRWSPQSCGRPNDHHIGYLWNAGRVTLSQFDSLWQFNVKAESSQHPCEGGLRPGHYARVQSGEEGGVDFHLIALHLKSGPTVDGVEKRHRALNQIDNVIRPLLEQDQDVVILGDLNTMGAGDWKSQGYELKSVRRQVAKEKPGFHDLPPTPQCTHYFRGRGGWLDHVIVAKDMQEVIEVSAKVSGYCAVAGCKRIKGDYPLAYRRLSDHCPVIFEIRNRDED
ncbi:MAG: endonuclease/exonuclease/phosphatase family protein [Nitrospirota bacterium]|nr:MAG: endonuclease/exonuclease/phosphatase family protein [Nitrospirota bacterium]